MLFGKRRRCGGLRMPDGLFIAAGGPFGTVQERGAQAWPFHFTCRSSCLSAMLRHNTSSSVYWFMANTHLRATSSLKERPCLGLQARQCGAQRLRTFLHVTQHITKERQQRERDYSGDLSASRPLFILSHLARRCQTTVISSKRC